MVSCVAIASACGMATSAYSFLSSVNPLLKVTPSFVGINDLGTPKMLYIAAVSANVSSKGISSCMLIPNRTKSIGMDVIAIGSLPLVTPKSLLNSSLNSFLSFGVNATDPDASVFLFTIAPNAPRLLYIVFLAL